MSKIYPVVMCGGSGTRLWPLSRRDLPKQFAIIQGGQTLFDKTYERASGIRTGRKTVLIAHENYRYLIRDALGDRRSNAVLLLEPIARNTTAAIGSAALHIAQTEPEAVLACMPADHEVGSTQKFADSVRAAAEIARDEWITVLGVVPSYPATSFGYIRPAETLASGAWRVARFVEKPTEARALEYCQEGYKWNSGLVVARADVLIEALKRFAPDVLNACRHALDKAQPSDGEILLEEQALKDAPSISFDYAVLEHHDKIAVINLESDWSDVGSWLELAKMYAPDVHGNRSVGQVEIRSSENAFVHSPERLTVALGLRDIVIVDTADALLVSDNSHMGELRDVVSALTAEQRAEMLSHKMVRRPWGSFISLELGKTHQVKRITVKPGGILSLQYHHHRSEHWVVVRGVARVTVGERQFDLKQNESTFIPQGAVHRLENPGSEDLEIIEVQLGSYLGEDDIVRISDEYGRSAQAEQREKNS